VRKENKAKNKFVVYRKYKEGELPYIVIQISDLLKPLQGLCLLDTTVASNLFGILYDALYSKKFEDLKFKY
jgi:hypothetical protein